MVRPACGIQTSRVSRNGLDRLADAKRDTLTGSPYSGIDGAPTAEQDWLARTADGLARPPRGTHRPAANQNRIPKKWLVPLFRPLFVGCRHAVTKMVIVDDSNRSSDVRRRSAEAIR